MQKMKESNWRKMKNTMKICEEEEAWRINEENDEESRNKPIINESNEETEKQWKRKRNESRKQTSNQ